MLLPSQRSSDWRQRSERRLGARNRGAVAQGRIPFVLEAALQSQEAHRETTDVEGSLGIDFPDGC